MSTPRRFNWFYLVYLAGALAIVSAAKHWGWV
jgi:hypothetical protein